SLDQVELEVATARDGRIAVVEVDLHLAGGQPRPDSALGGREFIANLAIVDHLDGGTLDRKRTRLNSSHAKISYAVFCLKKKTHNKAALAILFLKQSMIDSRRPH